MNKKYNIRNGIIFSIFFFQGAQISLGADYLKDDYLFNGKKYYESDKREKASNLEWGKNAAKSLTCDQMDKLIADLEAQEEAGREALRQLKAQGQSMFSTEARKIWHEQVLRSMERADGVRAFMDTADSCNK